MILREAKVRPNGRYIQIVDDYGDDDDNDDDDDDGYIRCE